MDQSNAEPLVWGWADVSGEAREKWERVVKKITPPPLLLDLTAGNLRLDDFDPKQLGAKVQQDAVLAGVVLAAANSARYGLTTPITSVQRAVVHLGFVMVKAVIASYQMEATFGMLRGIPAQHLRFTRQWSSSASILAHHLAQEADIQEPSTASTLALLTLLGPLVFAVEEPRPGAEYQSIQDERARLRYEQQVWGISSPVLASRLAMEWGLPQAISEGIAAMAEPLCQPVPENNKRLVIASVAIAITSANLRNQSVSPVEVLAEPGHALLAANLSSHNLDAPLSALWSTARLQRELSVARD